jgi:hypothetical protein
MWFPNVEENEPLNPMAIALFGSTAVLAGAKGIADAVEELGLRLAAALAHALEDDSGIHSEILREEQGTNQGHSPTPRDHSARRHQ